MSQGHSPATPLLSSLKLTALVTSPCRDARSVRPLCPSVTASVKSPCRDARSVRPLCQKLQRPLRRSVGTHGLCVHCVKSYSVLLCRQRTLRPSVPTVVVPVRPSCQKLQRRDFVDNGRSDRASLHQATHHLLRQLVMIE